MKVGIFYRFLKCNIDEIDIPRLVNINNFTTYKRFYKHYDCLYDLIEENYPNKFNHWELNRVSNGFWDNDDNILKYLKWFEKEMGITKPSDWYDITKKDIKKCYGYGLYQNKFQQKIMNITKYLYPDIEWVEYNFISVSKNYWDNEDNVLKYLKWFEKEMNITKPSDWYNITSKDLIERESILSSKFK